MIVTGIVVAAFLVAWVGLRLGRGASRALEVAGASRVAIGRGPVCRVCCSCAAVVVVVVVGRERLHRRRWKKEKGEKGEKEEKRAGSKPPRQSSQKLKGSAQWMVRVGGFCQRDPEAFRARRRVS